MQEFVELLNTNYYYPPYRMKALSLTKTNTVVDELLQ